MTIYTRPYTKKHFQKEGTSQDSTACKTVEVREGDILTRYLVKISRRSCLKCQEAEHGRVFRITGVSEVYDLAEDEPLSRARAHRNVGKTLCMDCLS